MATYIFQKIAKEGERAGVVRGTENARDWFRDRAQQVRQVDPERELRNTARLYNKIEVADIGRMYMFSYDPKNKETLPYYDKFPLIFVIDKYKDGFLGMNMHYLPLTYRARLMDKLYEIERNDVIREDKKLRLTYSLLNGVSKFAYFQPTIKRYLANHVRSRLLWIPYEDWDTALFLPTERFKKSKKTNVWKESKQMISKR
jgi:hypothetical protein